MNAENSHVWWALIEEITLRAEEMAGKKEIACCVRGYHIYMGSSNSGSAGVYSMEPTNIGKNFDVNIIRVNYLRMFSVYENIFTRKIKRITV